MSKFMQASAWLEIVEHMRKYVPDWSRGPGSGIVCMKGAIDRLAGNDPDTREAAKAVLAEYLNECEWDLDHVLDQVLLTLRVNPNN